MPFGWNLFYCQDYGLHPKVNQIVWHPESVPARGRMERSILKMSGMPERGDGGAMRAEIRNPIKHPNRYSLREVRVSCQHVSHATCPSLDRNTRYASQTHSHIVTEEKLREGGSAVPKA